MVAGERRVVRRRRFLPALLALALLTTGCGSAGGKEAVKGGPSCPRGRYLSTPVSWLSAQQLLVAVRRFRPMPSAGTGASSQVWVRLYRVSLPSLQTTLHWQRRDFSLSIWPQDQLTPDGRFLTAHPDAFVLWLVSLEDGRVVRRFSEGVSDFSFAPEGRRLVADGGADGSPLQILSLRGRTRTVTTRLDRNPSWSPDGRFIVFDRGRTMDLVKNMELPRDLYLLPAAGGSPRLLARGISGRAVWAPDSRRFALNGATISVYRLDGAGRLVGKPQLVKPATAYPSPVGWSPSGRLLVLRPGTAAARTLARPRYRHALLGLFSPDGRYLTLQLPQRQPLFLLDIRSGRTRQLPFC